MKSCANIDIFLMKKTMFSVMPTLSLMRCKERETTLKRNSLSAKEFANFIAVERHEKITTTIGYQDKLESQVAPTTILTLCQNEILLRTLMGNESFLRHDSTL